jgi:two-component sensor histidine kinase
MIELASFAGLALKMIQTEKQLKAALAQQETLAGEMSHRVKNLFALVNAMVTMTARTAENPKAMAEALSGRLHALATAHGLVRKSFADDAAETTNLRELAETVLRPHNGTHVVSGPDVSIGSHATNNVALVFHELATNAAKHGALREAGTVTVDWRIEDGVVHIDWAEHGGPVVISPTRKGFGTTLAEKTLSGSLDGTIEYRWKPEGLCVAMTVPVKRLRR